MQHKSDNVNASKVSEGNRRFRYNFLSFSKIHKIQLKTIFFICFCYTIQKIKEKIGKLKLESKLFVQKLLYAGFSFAPQTEHLPSAVIIGCLSTSFPQIPHFKMPHLPQKNFYTITIGGPRKNTFLFPLRIISMCFLFLLLPHFCGETKELTVHYNALKISCPLFVSLIF